MKVIRLIYLIFLPIALLSFYSVEVSPSAFGFFGILNFLILPSLLLNLGFLVYFVVRKRWKWVVFAVFLFLFGKNHISRTISISVQDEVGFKVLNANVRIFNVYQHLHDDDLHSSKEMIQWVSNSDADVMLLQEFYNVDTSRIFSTISKIGRKFPYHHLEVVLTNRINGQFGQIIFSKHPIVNKGRIQYDNKTFNQAIYADIKINEDTVRFYNVHLQSMAIEERKLFNDNMDESRIKKEVRSTFRKLVYGFTRREKQVANIIEHIKSSPYPVIMGADMNDIPYSYAYNEFSRLLNNSFEEKGNGFGFTFNGKLFFLRIDNLFVDPKLETNSFNVHREIKHSDHFPISATYSLNK